MRENLKKARQEAGMTQRQVAIKLDVTERYYRQIEAGDRIPLNCENSRMVMKKHFQGNSFSLEKKEQSCNTWEVVRARNHEILLFIIKLARESKS